MMTTTMTNDEVICMAKEAGLHKMIRHNWKVEVHTETLSPKLERFAELVAEATLEKAAQVCDTMWHPMSDSQRVANYCAEAIRANK